MADVLPKFMTFRFARIGIYGTTGSLPTGWAPEALAEVTIDKVDLRKEAASITLGFSFAASEPSEYVGLALGNYEQIDRDEPFVLKGDVHLTDTVAIEGAFWVIREWVSEGPYVGQATREIVIGSEPANALVVRTATDFGHVVQPVIVFKRKPGVAGGAKITLRKLVFGSLYRMPAWLSGEIQ